jgi:threonine dehydratase
LLEDVEDLDVLFVPVGGGGLCAGTAIAVARTRGVLGSPVAPRGAAPRYLARRERAP